MAFIYLHNLTIRSKCMVAYTCQQSVYTLAIKNSISKLRVLVQKDVIHVSNNNYGKIT